MNVAHTPGPWTIKNEESPLDFEMDLCVMAGEKTICHFFDSTPNDYVNACLIAAAPDLLEALQAVEILFACHCKDATALEWLDKARAAIAKATKSTS